MPVAFKKSRRDAHLDESIVRVPFDGSPLFAPEDAISLRLSRTELLCSPFEFSVMPALALAKSVRVQLAVLESRPQD